MAKPTSLVWSGAVDQSRRKVVRKFVAKVRASTTELWRLYELRRGFRQIASEQKRRRPAPERLALRRNHRPKGGGSLTVTQRSATRLRRVTAMPAIPNATKASDAGSGTAPASSSVVNGVNVAPAVLKFDSSPLLSPNCHN